MSASRVAAIDIGSNSIKILVAARSPDGGLLTVHSRAIDARISAGISRQRPLLGEEGMARGVEAIRSLLADADRFAVSPRVLVATSAVRDAINGAEFCRRVQETTGHAIRILSGEEEANLIGRGLTCDPALHHRRDFYLFDLGGGSLECLTFRDRQVSQALSLPLGCVRLTEKFVADSSQPFPQSSADALATYVREQLRGAGISFSLSVPAVAVGTGGTLTSARAVIGARDGRSLEETLPQVSLPALRVLLAWLGALPLAARREVKGLPPARADVFPAALATLIAVAEAGQLPAYHNSLYNLRYGLAAEVLDAE